MSYESAVLADSPRRYYRLQDSLADGSGNGGGAIVRGAGGAEPAYATGIVDASPRGLSFDGTADYAYLPAPSPGTSTKLSLTFWANFAAFSGVQVWAELSSLFNENPLLFSGCKFVVYSDGSDLQVAVANFTGGFTPYSYETWVFPLPGTDNTHVAVVFDRTLTGAGRCKVFYNASQQTPSSSSTDTSSSFFSADSLYLMSRAGSAYFQGGLLDDIATWDAALTGAQISTHHAAGTSSPAYISGSSSAAATGSLSLTTGGPATIAPNPSNATAAASLALTANQQIPFNASNAAASGTLDLTTVSATGSRAAPGWLGLFITDTGGASVPLIAGGSNAVATGSLSLQTPSPGLISGSSQAIATGSLTLRNTSVAYIVSPTTLESPQFGSSTLESAQHGSSTLEPDPVSPIS